MQNNTAKKDSNENSNLLSGDGSSGIYEVGKRILDVTASLFLLVLLTPVLLIVALAVKLDSSGPVFADIPGRVGKGGKLFRLYKFRSMIPKADEILRHDPRLKKLLQRYRENNYKLKDDPRVTRVGSFIRRHSIDEFPQLINVIKGEMSLVGPRPYHDFELKEQSEIYPLAKKYIKIVHEVKPGITGQWQVSGRSEVDFDKRIMLDAQYARQKNLLLDIIILLKTPWAVINGKGAY